MALPHDWAMYVLDLTKEYARENIILISKITTVEEMWSAIATVAMPWSVDRSQNKRAGVMFIFCIDDESEYVSPIMEDNIYWAKSGQRHVCVCTQDVGLSYFENMVLDVVGGSAGDGVKAFAYSCVGNTRKLQAWTNKETDLRLISGGKLLVFPKVESLADEDVSDMYNNYYLGPQTDDVAGMKAAIQKYCSRNLETTGLKPLDIARAPINVTIDRTRYQPVKPVYRKRN